MEKISIIIPVFNEAIIIQEVVSRLLDYSNIEIIVVDGGSQDKTVELVKEVGVNIIVSPQAGRAIQMNLGAASATGEILLFLHADTQLPMGYQETIIEILSCPRTIAGAFELAIASPEKSLRFIEQMVNLRSRFLSLPYGDQALFLKASVFKTMGGFSNLPIMEDFEFVRRLNKKGKIAIAPTKVITSSRRWHKFGVFKTTLINQFIIVGYYLGISPKKLARLYGRK